MASPLEKPVPPAGEEIHLPGQSIQPILITIGVTLALIGVTFNLWVCIFGVVLTALTIVRWVADARRDIDALPVHSDHH